MTQRTLLHFSKVGLTSTFYDPDNVNNRFTHSVEKKGRPGNSKVPRVTAINFSSQRHFLFKPCESDCGVNQFVSGTVRLSGSDAKEVLQNWKDLKANVDAAIAAGALKGVPLPTDLHTLVIDSGVTG